METTVCVDRRAQNAFDENTQQRDRKQMQRVFTPEQVAAMWQCSSNHVRNLIHRGELRAFRLGGRLFRIPAEAIQEFEAAKAEEQSSLSVPVTPKLTPYDPSPIVIVHSREREPHIPKPAAEKAP